MADLADDAIRRLAEARAGSGEALGEALEQCRQYLLLIAGKELDPELHAKGGASDLVQQTFLEAQCDFAQFHGTSEAELRAWLRQLLLHNVSNFTRRYRGTRKRAVHREVGIPADDSVSPGLELTATNQTPSSAAIDREQSKALQRALERLPDDYRQVIVYRYLEGRSFEEIGRLMNRSDDAASKLWSRAMRQLRKEWEGSP
jgi:RNA polymerase sigma-70 factor (ECF subfamily)